MSAAPRQIAAIPADQSARRTFAKGQLVAMVVVTIVFLLELARMHMAALRVAIAIVIFGYVLISVYKIYILYIAVRRGTPEFPAVEGDDVPVYTILVPLYREAVVIPGLLTAIDELDYPHDKLEVIFLLEEDDEETLRACSTKTLPPCVRLLIVPQGYPKTKPRACNEGLAAATGEFLVIFDAEDRPEPSQLRKALAAFAASPAPVVCQQAKLAYYNQRQNILTRMFTIDYANWFEGILPGLTWLEAPIPLGGTSNHFRTETLRTLGGWDPYNVAEDADLGIRLARHGYRTAMFESVTWEEANSKLRSWVKQRSRWTKGYMQTFLVHTRHPVQLWRELGAMNMWRFIILVAGTWFAGLLNPLFWLLGILYYVTRSTAIEALFWTPIYYLGLFCLVIGNFVFIYMNVYTAVKWGYDGLAKWALLTPIYWVLHSIAAYMALYELLVRPHHWQKTTHGLAAQAVATRVDLAAAAATVATTGNVP
jgi:cellulose synthase/poly-beta-1,6-N-acetylglucosamine synthase-like glycosyltransferase